MAEKMIRCPEGHFYDPSKHLACPWCAQPQEIPYVRPTGLELSAVLPPPLPAASAAPPPPLFTAPAPAAQPAPVRPMTIPPDLEATATGRREPVVGWLVCLEGPDRGKDFRLRIEKNYIGRSAGMDVVIDGDNTVSRERHGLVIFDPKRQAFWVLPGDASGLVYLNGELVNTPMEMQRDDVIELGQTKLVLIPFCGDKYRWDDPAE